MDQEVINFNDMPTSDDKSEEDVPEEEGFGEPEDDSCGILYDDRKKRQS